MSRMPLIIQAEAAECGLACLAMISCYHGAHTDLNILRRRYPVSLKGATLRTLIQVSGNMGLTSRALRFSMDTLPQLQLPAVVHWDMSHFVVLKTVSSNAIVVMDPAQGERRLTLAEAANHLTGIALELSPATGLERKDERSRLSFSAFLGGFKHGHALAQVLVLSLALEVLVVVAPLYMQLTMDQVIALGDADLLVVLAVGFGFLAAVQVGITALRSLILLVVQSALHFEMAARLFHHLIRLPLAYFEKRHIGDVLSRFTSIEPIRNMIAEGMIAASVDGVMALVTAAMIFFYSVKLGLIVTLAFALYAITRVALFSLFWRRTEETIRTKARQDSTFIETLRAMQSIKLFNREEDREGHWLNGYAAFVNSNVQLGRARIGFKAINDGLFAAENVISIFVAAHLVLSGALTVGMIFAFVSYKRNFTDKAALLVEKLIEFRIIGLHLERLSDIAVADLERGHDRPLSYTRKIDGRIELRDVCFRYAEGEPFVLEHINLVIEAGQFVTIMGASGSGKTTLVKIMLGLLEPTIGEVLIDGVPLPAMGYRPYREQIAAVMQEDQLLSGSVADNICFFDPSFDQERMVFAARLACVDDEIMRMPMAYNSLIGDMGSSLSGGQKQRVLMARALYRNPRILFLDEGTAHLNVEIERAINQNLRELQITRVSIAHRPEMMSGADVVLRIDGGSTRTTTRL